MNARPWLLLATLCAAAPAAAAPGVGAAAAQAGSALDTSRIYDGTPEREQLAVYAGADKKKAADPAQLAEEEQARAKARAGDKPVGSPVEPPKPKPEPLTAWNPMLSGAKNGLLMAIAGFTLGGPLGLLVGAAAGGFTGWGMGKINDA